MSWILRISIFFASAVLSLNAWGQRYQFNEGATKATSEAHLVSRNAGMSPVEIKLTVPAVDLSDGDTGFKRLKVEGLSPMGLEGTPELFTTGHLVAVPDGYEPELTVVSQDQQEVKDVVIQPAQRMMRCKCDQALNFSFNSSLYHSTGLYPAKNIELQEVGKLQGLRLVRVALNPTQMDMSRKTLKVTTSMVVRVDFRKSTRSARRITLSKSAYRLARALTVNGSDLDDSEVGSSDAETMLIVVADDLANAIQPLVVWKESKGIHTDVVTFTDAGGSKESVKDYIQNYYDKATVKPSYLLMVGNKDSLPPYMEDTSSGPAASDYRFALLSGDENIPAVFYGRLVADNADEVTTQVERWVAYEKTPEQLNWYQDATAIAGPKGSNPSDEENGQQVQSILKQYTYKAVDGFFKNDGTATVSNVDKALESGRSWVTFFGDGSGTGWSWDGVNENFGNSDVQKLDNTRLPFIIDVACLNASWATLQTPFAKAWVTQKTNGKASGAVAYLGGSTTISWDPPAIMAIGIAKSHFEQAIPTLGGSVLAGQLYLIAQVGTTSDSLDNLKWYNLLGDPSLVMRTDTPKAYHVKYAVNNASEDDSSDDATAGTSSLTVTATDSAGNPVAGLLASIALANQAPLAVGKTDSSGSAVLSVPAGTTIENGTALTVTGVNADTYQTAIQNR